MRKYVCFGPKAARGHAGINTSQEALKDVPPVQQEVLMKYARHADWLHEHFMPPEELYRARWAKKVSGCPTFQLPDVVGDCEFVGAWTMGINVALNIYVDPGDFLWSHASIQC